MMIRLKRYVLAEFVGVGLTILSGMLLSISAQNTMPNIPLVINGKIPIYPLIAIAAQIQGVVRLRVVTNGEKVTSAVVQSGPPMLARSAKENVLTWEFSKHKSTTFVTTFKYEIEGPNQCVYSNGSSILNLPLEVQINAKGIETCDPAVKKTKSHR